MKILRTFSGSEYILQDDEADNILKVKETGQKAFLALRCGANIDTAAIEGISPIPLVPTRYGKIVQKTGWYVRDGLRVYVEDWDDVSYIPDPRYTKQLEKNLLGGGNQKNLT